MAYTGQMVRVDRIRSPWVRCAASPLCVGLSIVLLLLVLGCQSESALEKAAALHGEGRNEEALTVLRAAVDEGSRDPELLYRYGVALSRGGGTSLAMWPLREAALDPEWFGRAMLAIASGAYRSGNYEFAIQELGLVIEREPDDSDALRVRAMARLKSRRDYEGALEDIDRVMEIELDATDMRVPRIVALLGLERIEEAGEALGALSSEDLDSGEEEEDEESAAASLGEPFEILVCAAGAKFAEEKDEAELAEERYAGCLERFPGASLVIKEALDFYQEKGDGQRVNEILADAYESSPQDRSIRIAWARTLQLQGRIEEAEAILREAAEAKLPGAWLALSGFLVDADRVEQALEVYAQGDELGVSGPEFLLAYAEALLAAERYGDSLKVVERIKVKSHAVLLRGRIALAQGRAVEALKLLGEGTLLWPDNAVARYYTARAAEQAGEFDRAIEEYRYAIRVDAKATDARERITRLHLAENNLDAALYMIRYEDRNTRGGERSEEALLLEMEALGQTSVEGRAVPPRLARKLQDPEVWGRAVAALARGAWRRGGAAAAAATVRGADRLNLEETVAAPALRILVESLAAQGETAEGLEAARKAVSRNRDSREQVEILAHALREAGEFRESLEHFEALLGVDAENRGLLLGSAQAHFQAGDRAAAQEVLLRAEAISALEAAELREEAGLWLALGDPGRAEARLRDALALAPHDGAAAEALAGILAAAGAAEEEVSSLRSRASRFSAGSRSR